MNAFELVDKLEATKELNIEEWEALIEAENDELAEYIFAKARRARDEYYGHKVFVRGLIEFTNYCKNDCLYCGIRHSNSKAERYRLSKEQILDCCKLGYELGYRTFVLQGGEDPFYNDEMVVDIVSTIKQTFPDCAITLSIGEKSYDSYAKFKAAGADRYLLRHETANACHYAKLHMPNQLCEVRKECLRSLKALGFQVGAGFMVGAPHQTASNLAEDMVYLKELNPAMVGIGPFLPHQDTPFHAMPAGSLKQTLFMLGLIRLMLPGVLLPATTALGTIHPDGRKMGMNAGANVVMPNLSPKDVRKNYLLYDSKIGLNDEAAESKARLEAEMRDAGYEIVVGRGDSLNMEV